MREDRKSFITTPESKIMDVEHLRQRIESETSIPDLLGEDYMITTVENNPQRRRKPGVMVARSRGREDTRKMILNLMENKKDDIGVMKIEYIAPHDEKGEWFSDQVSAELNQLPYILRERKSKKDAHNGEEAVYVAEYAVDTDWIESEN